MIYEARPYGCDVTLVHKMKDWEAAVGIEVEGECSGITGWSETGVVVLVADGNIATLVHECVHASIFILEYVGIDVSSNNGECLAYLVDNMFAYFMESIMAKKKGSFATKQAAIAKKEGVSQKAAGAILASASRGASAKAKKANPNLKKVKGKAK